MEGLRFGQAADRRGSLRRRIVLLVALPTALLGLTYFLFVEYMLENPSGELGLVLRVGGAILLLLGLVLGVTSGYLLSERVTRPIRLLIRLADSGETEAGRTTFLHHREWEIFELYRRVHSLAQQNRAGARAVEELESLRSGLASLRGELSRRGQHGILPAITLPAEAPWSEIAQSLEANRQRSLAFIAELAERTSALRRELELLGESLGLANAGQFVSVGDFTDSQRDAARATLRPATLGRVRRIGTVLALETERLRPANGDSLGQWLDRFEHDMCALEAEVDSLVSGHGEEQKDRSRTDRWRQILDSLAALERRAHEVEA